MQELSDRVNAALESCQGLTAGSRPLLVSRNCTGMPGEYDSPDYQHGRTPLRLRNCSISRVDYQEACGWRLAGSLKPQGTSHLDAPALDELQR